jgi:hypothetical protein
MPADVTPVKTGALNRIFTLVGNIKDVPSFNSTIGADLAIVGIAETAPDYATARPVLSVLIIANRVEIGWDWQGYAKFLDMCEIQVDRDDAKGWVLLAFDTTPGYIDTTPFPAALTRWKYRAIYHMDDAPVGQWSAEVSVIVGG